MAEEKVDENFTFDDVTMLRRVLHTVRGISPVSSCDFVEIPLEDADVTY